MTRLTPAGRRYLIRFVPAMTAYVVVLLGVVAVLKPPHAPTGPIVYLLAAAPALPVLVVIWAMGRFIVEETDEYLRARQVEAMLWATGLTLGACTVWGFLETYAPVPHVPAYFAFILFCLCLGVVQCVRRAADRLSPERG